MMLAVQVIDRAHVPAKALAAAERAVQDEANGEFRREWLAGRRLVVSARPARGAWKLYIERQSQMPASPDGVVSGYHTLVRGRPTAYVSSADLAMGLSHEVLETAADPYENRRMPDGLLAEVCDPVEDAPIVLVTMTSKGIGVETSESNWVRPRWFKKGARGRMDAGGVVRRAGDATFGLMPPEA